ncbi:MAG: serine/threonine protein kinase [Deltaproteobacteria bacterium]|nr:serine/threonine protein kinase [Deltaproteobacteria bacterium]
MSSEADSWKSEGLPRPGTTIVARYRLDEGIARGGMSMIYRAHDLFHERDVVLKVLPRKLLTPRSHARFMREARLASLVEHPNVVLTYDAGLMEDGTPYIVMEHLEGRSLYQRLKAETTIPLDESKAILACVCSGVHAAHEQGVIHRDLKPSNVLVLADGVVKVIDFGLSKEIHDPGPSITGPAEALGTPSYMSPEQVFADPADARSDVWGAGVLLYEMLTGVEAFPLAKAPPGPRQEALVQRTFKTILSDEPQPVSERVAGLPPAIDAVISRALEKDPAERFQTMSELADALAQV